MTQALPPNLRQPYFMSSCERYHISSSHTQLESDIVTLKNYHHKKAGSYCFTFDAPSIPKYTLSMLHLGTTIIIKYSFNYLSEKYGQYQFSSLFVCFILFIWMSVFVGLNTYIHKTSYCIILISIN